MYVKIYNDDNECVGIIDPEISGPFSSEQEERDWVEEGTMQAIGEAFLWRKYPPNKAINPTPDSGPLEQSSKSK